MNRTYRTLLRLLAVFIFALGSLSFASGAVLLDNGANTTTGWVSLDGLTAGTVTFSTDTSTYESSPASLKITDSSGLSGSFRRYALPFTTNASSGTQVNATFYARGTTNGASLHEWGLRTATNPATNVYTNDIYAAVIAEAAEWKYRTSTSGSAVGTGTGFAPNVWYKVSIVYNVSSGTAGTWDFYIDDSLQASAIDYYFTTNAPTHVAFQATGSASQGTSFIDSIIVTDNSTPAPPANITYVALTAVDAYDDSSINEFNASLTNSSGTYEFQTTNGTIVTNITTNSNSLYNITYTAEDYFSNTSLNVNVSSGTYQGSLAQAYVYFSCFEAFTNESLGCDPDEPLPRAGGSYSDDVNVTDYFSVRHDYNITPLGGTGDYRVYSATPTSFSTSGSWVNSESLNDDDWDTFAYSESGTTAYAYWNYTGTYTNVYWKADGGSGATEENLSLSASCQTNPQIRVVSISPELGSQSVRIYCWDGSSWDQLSNLGVADRSVYEVGVGVVLSSYTAHQEEVTGFYDYNLTVEADDYAGNPETDFNITVTNEALGVNYSDTASGTSITYQLLAGYTYSVVLNATSTIYGDPVNQVGYANVTNTGTPPTSETYQFNLSAARPITISLYYEENLSIFEEDTNITLVPLTDSSTLFLNVTISNGSTTLYNVPVSEYRVRGVSSGYHDEDRFIVLGTYTGSAVDLYFRENTTGEEKEFNVVDNRNILQNGWYVRFQRYYNDTGWVTVDEARSNVDGLAVENVLETEYYRLILLNEDFGEEYRSERTLLLESVYQISSDTTVATNTQINKVLGVSGLITINPNTNIVTATGSSSSGSRDWKLDLYRYYTDGAVLINSTTTSGDSITLSLPLPSSEARYEAVLSILGSEIPIADNGYNRGLGPESFGTSGAFYAFALLIGIVGLAVFSAPAAIVLSVFSIIISNLIGVLSISIGAIVGLAIVGGIIIYRRNN